jgi:hypothetical protein
MAKSVYSVKDSRDLRITQLSYDFIAGWLIF